MTNNGIRLTEAWDLESLDSGIYMTGVPPLINPMNEIHSNKVFKRIVLVGHFYSVKRDY